MRPWKRDVASWARRRFDNQISHPVFLDTGLYGLGRKLSGYIFPCSYFPEIPDKKDQYYRKADPDLHDCLQ